MNDKVKLTNFFKRAEETPKTEFSLTEVGAGLPDELEKQRMLETQMTTLNEAERVLDEAA
jgi:hypothetical protein